MAAVLCCGGLGPGGLGLVLKVADDCWKRDVEHMQ